MKKSLYGVYRDTIEICIDEKIIENFHQQARKNIYTALFIHIYKNY